MNVDKIARKIIGFKENISVLTDIEEIVIVVTSEPITTDMKKYASRDSFYSLNEVKQLLNCKPPRYVVEKRNDNKTDFKMINMEETECIEVIKNLTEDKYHETLYNAENPADVYLLSNYKRINDNEINLYIKFSVEGKRNRRHVLIISFHPEGM